MKKWVIGFFVLSLPGLNAGSWVPAQQIPEGASSGVQADVFLTYDAATGTVIAAWGNALDSSRLPYYSVFNGKSWTTAAAIPRGASVGVQDESDVFLTYDAATGTVIAAWGDSTALVPYYSVFNGTSWTTAATIPPGASGGVYDVNLTYDAARETVIAAWRDSATNAPYYSVFNGANWTTAATIPLGVGGSVGVDVDVFLTYDAATETVIAAWGDSSSFLPYYSVFNGTDWTTAATIPPGASSEVYDNVTLAYNPVSQTVFAAWEDAGTTSPLPYYSIFDGTAWTTGAIPPGTSAGVNFNVYLAFDASSNQMIAAWGNYPGTPLPYYATYFLSPTNLSGEQLNNDFAVVSELYNQLRWQASPSIGVVGYNVYRNGALIATVNALEYQDHNRQKGVATSYSVSAVNDSGVQSSSVNVVIQ